MAVDGVAMMQMFAIREGAMALGCDPRMNFFGIFNGTENGHFPADNGCKPADYFTRGEIRQHFAKNLQQVTGNKVFGNYNVGTVDSIGNVTISAHNMGADCLTSPLMSGGTPTTCYDGAYINTTVSEKVLLGFSDAQITYLQSFVGSPINTSVASSMPVARFSYLISGLTVTFDASASTGATSYSWNFGTGGTQSGGTTTQPVVGYSSAGQKTVVLSATNASGTTTKTMYITLTDPGVMFTAATGTFSVNDYTNTYRTVTINDFASANTVTTFVNWGDGNSANMTVNSSATHTYVADGTYTIIVAHSNTYGATTATHAVVTVPIKATISGVITSAATGSFLDAFITVTNQSTLALVSAYSNTTSGSYAIRVPMGTYTVTAAKYGYVFTPATAVVSSTSGTTVNLAGNIVVSAATYTISGVVDNAPAGLLIVCHPTSNLAVVTAAQYTDGTGAFMFPGIAAGDYTISAEPGIGSSVTPTYVNIVSLSSSTVISAGTWTFQ
jgi:PKD repeat protein